MPVEKTPEEYYKDLEKKPKKELIEIIQKLEWVVGDFNKKISYLRKDILAFQRVIRIYQYTHIPKEFDDDEVEIDIDDVELIPDKTKKESFKSYV